MGNLFEEGGGGGMMRIKAQRICDVRALTTYMGIQSSFWKIQIQEKIFASDLVMICFYFGADLFLVCCYFGADLLLI